MLIDIPVFIAFNATNAVTAYRNNPSTIVGRTVTMRFDPEDTDLPITVADIWPPDAETHFHTDKDGVLAGILPRDFDAKFLALAEANPADYLVNQDAKA